MSNKRGFEDISTISVDKINDTENDETQLDEIDALLEACESNNLNGDTIIVPKKVKKSDTNFSEFKERSIDNELFENLEIPNSPHIKIITLENQQNCTHEVSLQINVFKFY